MVGFVREVKKIGTRLMGQATFTFLENLSSDIDRFFQAWFDLYKDDNAGSKNLAKNVFLDAGDQLGKKISNYDSSTSVDV
jgi:hypothetical protein